MNNASSNLHFPSGDFGACQECNLPATALAGGGRLLNEGKRVIRNAQHMCTNQLPEMGHEAKGEEPGRRDGGSYKFRANEYLSVCSVYTNCIYSFSMFFARAFSFSPFTRARLDAHYHRSGIALTVSIGSKLSVVQIRSRRGNAFYFSDCVRSKPNGKPLLISNYLTFLIFTHEIFNTLLKCTLHLSNCLFRFDWIWHIT